MYVMNGLATLVAGIDNKPEAVPGQPLVFGYLLSGQQQFTHQGFVFCFGIAHTAEVFARNNQYMCWRRRVNIMKRVYMVIAVNAF